MKKLIALLLLVSSFSLYASYQDLADANLRYHRITPCQSWSSMIINNRYTNTCNYKSLSINVPDANSLVDLLNAMEEQYRQRLEVLENRIKALEAHHPNE